MSEDFVKLKTERAGTLVLRRATFQELVAAGLLGCLLVEAFGESASDPEGWPGLDEDHPLVRAERGRERVDIGHELRRLLCLVCVGRVGREGEILACRFSLDPEDAESLDPEMLTEGELMGLHKWAVEDWRESPWSFLARHESRMLLVAAAKFLGVRPSALVEGDGAAALLDIRLALHGLKGGED